MSNPVLIFLLINGITGAAYVFYNHYIDDKDIHDANKNINDKEEYEKRIEYLCNKICKLESTVFHLQQTVEDMEEKFIKKENALIQSNCELNTKLEDFINYNYDMLDE